MSVIVALRNKLKPDFSAESFACYTYSVLVKIASTNTGFFISLDLCCFWIQENNTQKVLLCPF